MKAHQKRWWFLMGFDFLFARLHPSYKIPSVQRARNDERYKASGSLLLLLMTITA